MRHATWIYATLLCAALIIFTRWPLVPKRHLYHIDNVNFALALDDFNPALDQPQPPGDPLYVGFTRLLRFAFSRPEILFPISGIIGSTIALVLIWWLAREMFSPAAGISAALVLALSPVFWLAGVGNYVRTYLALGSLAVASLVWLFLTTGKRRFCYLAAAALGIAAGFRPEGGVLLAPLVGLCFWRTGLRFRDFAIVLACFAGTVLPWLIAVAIPVGGVAALFRLNSAYLARQSAHTSALFGASAGESIRMTAAAVYWIFLGALSWVWTVVFAARKAAEVSRPVRLLLAAWFIPPFVFYVFVHIHNPDQALTIIPALCIVGGWAISRLNGRAFGIALAAAAGLNILLFFYPRGSPFWASNYRIAEYTIKTADAVYDALAHIRGQGPVTFLWHDGFITPQEIGYYYRDLPIIAMAGTNPAQVRLHNRYLDTPNGAIELQPGKVVWIDPVAAAGSDFFAPLGAGTPLGPLHVAEVTAGQEFELGTARFRVVGPK